MSKWQQVKLGDIASNIQTGPFGSQLHQSDYSEIGTPVVMPKDLVDGKISEQSIARVEASHVKRLAKHKIQNGDILYSRRGDVGRCAYAGKEESGWLCGTGCLRVTIDESKANSKFIFYQLRTSQSVGWVEKHAVGSTMLNLNTSILSNVPVSLPPLEVQRKIADILSAYDDLIENNRKQIKLLEEAAQRLYKEWFIDLRFPGHETTKIINGIPDGWEKKCIGDICQTIGGGTPSTKIKEYYQGGTIKWVTPTDITRNNSIFLLDTEKKITNAGLSNSSAKLLPPFTILMTSRASVGYFALCEHEVCTNQGFISCIPHQPEARYFLLYNLMNRVDEIRQKAGGSTYLEINKNTFRSLSIIYPVEKICMEFTNILHPIMKRILSHKKTLELAIQSRNCLLPKLMTGELEVR